MPAPISVTVRYDAILQEITGTPSESVVMSSGSTFVNLLMNVFMARPGIQEKYPPGTLGLMVNGAPPRPYHLLSDGDIIDFEHAK